jgi:hypothetical protein
LTDQRKTCFFSILALLSNIPCNAKWIKYGTTISGGYRSDTILKHLESPHGLYVDENQMIYRAGYDNHRIVELNSDAKGTKLVAGGNGPKDRTNQLNKPTDIILDKESYHL